MKLRFTPQLLTSCCVVQPVPNRKQTVPVHSPPGRVGGVVAGGLETPAIVVSLEHHGFGWLQEERQHVNSRKEEGHFIDEEGHEQSLA